MKIRYIVWFLLVLLAGCSYVFDVIVRVDSVVTVGNLVEIKIEAKTDEEIDEIVVKVKNKETNEIEILTLIEENNQLFVYQYLVAEKGKYLVLVTVYDKGLGLGEGSAEFEAVEEEDETTTTSSTIDVTTTPTTTLEEATTTSSLEIDPSTTTTKAVTTSLPPVFTTSVAPIETTTTTIQIIPTTTTVSIETSSTSSSTSSIIVVTTSIETTSSTSTTTSIDLITSSSSSTTTSLETTSSTSTTTSIDLITSSSSSTTTSIMQEGVYFEPSLIDVGLDEEFTISVDVNSDEEIIGLGFDIIYDETQVEFIGMDEGDFLSDDCQAAALIDSSSLNKVYFMAFRADFDCNAVSGSGQIVTFNFRSLDQTGSSQISFDQGFLALVKQDKRILEERNWPIVSVAIE